MTDNKVPKRYLSDTAMYEFVQLLTCGNNLLKTMFANLTCLTQDPVGNVCTHACVCAWEQLDDVCQFNLSDEAMHSEHEITQTSAACEQLNKV